MIKMDDQIIIITIIYLYILILVAPSFLFQIWLQCQPKRVLVWMEKENVSHLRMESQRKKQSCWGSKRTKLPISIPHRFNSTLQDKKIVIEEFISLSKVAKSDITVQVK